MIFPLVLLALGVAAFATYEISPKAHEWVDEHVQAVNGALAAHAAATDHLDAVKASAPTAPPSEGAPHITAAATNVVIAAKKSIEAKKAATAMGDHPAAEAAHRVADLVAALTAAKADEIEATSQLQVFQGAGYGHSAHAQLLQQRIQSAQNREAVLQDQLAMIGQRAGSAIREGLSSSSSPVKAQARDPWV